MSSGCGDVLSLEDLKTAKKHQIFEAEVITGLQGGVAGGVAIDYATNQVTGQSQKTLPAILRDAGFRPASFTFATGGTLDVGDSDMAVLWPISAGGDGQYYIWKGTYPKVIPAASTPTSSGGVSDTGWMPIGDITLRGELALSSGAGLIGFNSSLTYSSGTVGNSLVKALTNPQKNIVFATADAGIPNDGTDVSTQVAAFLNANKGKFIVFDSGSYQFANIVLSGSGWEGTVIHFKGKHLLKPCTGNLDNTPGYPFYGGIILTKDVNGLTLHYEGDGNRALQFERQHIFNVAIWGAINITIPYFNVVEFMGDGLYINSSDQTSSTAQNAGNINIGVIKGVNSTVGGRNLVSIVSCIRGSIGTLLAENIGGVIQGEQQPGGIDFEPNDLPGCIITDFVVVQATVIGAGNIQMVSPVAASPKKIRNCHILSSSLRNSNQTFRLYGTSFSSIKGDATSVVANAGMIEGCDNSTLDIKANACETIVLAGLISPNSNCVIKAHGVNVRNAGIITAGGVRCDYDLFIDNFVTGGSGNYIGLWFRDSNSIGGMEQRDCRYRLRIAKGTLGTYAIQYTTTPVITFTGDNKIEPDCVFNGWPDFLHVTGLAGQYLNIDGKIQGLTVSNGVPGNGTWKQGAFVYYSNPSTTNKFLGYYRITTGGNNVVGTDWGTVSFV